MGEITNLAISSAISKTIRDATTTEEIAAIYKDKPLQNVQSPYAVVFPIDLSINSKAKLKDGAERVFAYDVRVHPNPNSASKYSDLLKVGEKIILSLQKIYTLDDLTHPIRCTMCASKIVEEVLHITVTYSVHVQMSTTKGPDMEQLDYGSRLKY